MLQTFIRKVFGVFPGEGKNVFRFIKLATIWAIGSCIAETLAIGLFTEKIGARHLPKTYMLTAITLISVSCLYMYLLRFVSPYKIMIGTMSVAAIVYSSISITLFTVPPRWFWFFLQIFSYTFGSALIACFWIFLDQYHDLQDAKRIYGVYNAAYFLGYIISGTLINLAYEKLGPAILFSIVIFTMIHSILEARKISKTVPAMEDDVTEDYFSGSKKTFLSIFREFAKSPFALSVVIMSLVVQLLRTCTEYGYLDTLEKVFVTSSHETLPQFLGKCKAMIAAANIVIGIFFYRNLVTRMGLANLILLPPIYFMSVYSRWIAYKSLFIAILGVIAIECILYTIEDNNFNLLISTAPQKLRGILRLINDSFFEPIGMLFSSLFLILLTSEYRALGFTLSILFIAISLVVKYLYPKSIINSLKQHEFRFDRKIFDWLNKLSKKELKENKKALFKKLSSNNEKSKLLAISILLEFKDKNILIEILKSISDSTDNVKIKSIDILANSFFKDENIVINQINTFKSYSENENLINKSHFYLAKKGLLDPEKTKKDLKNKDLLLRASAIISLKHPKRDENDLNIKLAKFELKKLFLNNAEKEISIALDIVSITENEENIKLTLDYLFYPSLQVKRKAANAFLKIADKNVSKYAFKVIEALKKESDNTFRLFLLKALIKTFDIKIVKPLINLSIFFRPNEKRLIEKIILNMKSKAIDLLSEITKDTTLNERARALSSKILSKISPKDLKLCLKNIINLEIEKAYFYFYSAHTIQKRFPKHNLILLKSSLLSGFQSVMDFIIHLVIDSSFIEDPELIIKALHNKSTKNHAHAIETLERNVSKKLFSKIQPLIDDIPLEYQLKESKKHIDENLNLKDFLQKLEKYHLFFDRNKAFHLKENIHKSLLRTSNKNSINQRLKVAKL